MPPLPKPVKLRTYLRSWHVGVVHLIAIFGVLQAGWSWKGFGLAVALYYARMFFITAGYHRYFAHRSYKTSRVFQWILAFGATTSVEKGVLWWASQHRHHHKFSDTPEDIHSPKQDGFWWSHIGWILTPDYEGTRWDNIKDFAKYPELRSLNQHYLLPPVLMAATLLLVGGWHGLLWGFFVSTVFTWHGTFTINSLSHVFGSRRYETTDTSRNNLWLAFLTMGEGWHNNHHHYMSSANQGFRWYEIDMTYYILKTLSFFHIVWDLRRPPQHIVENRPKRQVTEYAEEPELVRQAA